MNPKLNELRSWLQNNSKGYYTLGDKEIYNAQRNYEGRIDGIVLQNIYANEMSSYFEVLNSGFVEAGFSTPFFYTYQDSRDHNKSKVAMYLTSLIGYEMALLSFARKFYAFANYYDDVLLQLSIVNVQEFTLNGLSGKESKTHRFQEPTNKAYENFKLTARFNPERLSDQDILEIAKDHSEKICRAFGLEKECCFDEGEKMNQHYLLHFEI